MTLTRVQIHDLLYLVRASSFVPGMTKEKKEDLELSLIEELRKLDNPERKHNHGTTPHYQKPHH